MGAGDQRLIGYWIDGTESPYPPPQELMGDLDPDLRLRIAEYLDAGAEYCIYRGVSWCRLAACEHPMGSRELTDGRWVWPEGLAHYVRDHGVLLPDEFVADVRAWSGERPSYVSADSDWPDTSFWIEWCDQHRSHAYRE